MLTVIRRFRNRFAPTLAVLAATILLSACQGGGQPNPEDTLGSGALGSNRPDYVDVVGEYGSGAAGLSPRGGAGGLDGTPVEGLLPSIFFEFDSSAIPPGQRSKLEQAAEYLSENPRASLLIEGHADWRGTSEYNLALGDRRAGSVKNYLTTLGVDASRLQTTSKGDLEAVEEASDLQMNEDRRADLLVLQ